jgi:hypothetical protein
MPAKLPPDLPQHPAVRQSLTFFVMGAMMLVGGGVTLSSPGGWVATPLFFGLGAGLLSLGRFVRKSGPAAQAINLAHNLSTAGRIAEAEERYAELDATISLRYLRRVIAVNRAWIALRRGDLERAVAFAGEAIDRPVQWISRRNERCNIVEARGLRAVALASLGDASGAEQDIAAILASPLATPSALARAELARALLLEQAGDRAVLGAHLAKHRRLLREHTHPRERAIVRAYQRMLEAQATSVYRHGAPREPAPRDEPALSDWVAKLAPGAASFVPAETTRSTASSEAPRARAAPDAIAAARARFDRKGSNDERGAKALGLWTLLIVLFLAVWQFLTPQRSVPTHVRAPAPMHGPMRADPSLLGILIPVLLGLFFGGLLLLFARQKRARSPQLSTAQAALARGDEETALAMLTALSSGPALVAGPALLTLATERERSGDLRSAQALCERGIARAQQIAAAASDILLPALFAEHALILAARGESGEAAAELALIEERHPSFAYLDAARFRITLVDAARRGDFTSAAQIAAKSADLPLTVRDELLADIVRVLADADSRGEVERLRKELRTDAVSRAWIEKVAPSVLSAFEHTGSDARAVEAPSDSDEEAEREALAEEEARREASLRA